MKRIFVLIFFILFARAELPVYAYKMITKFRLNTNYMINWSLAESTHCKYQTSGYYGRYNIGTAVLSDYLRLTRQWNTPIPSPGKYLEDDRNNCYIAYWLCRFYLNLGFSYEEFFQIWLWGARNVYSEKRYSPKYQKLITGDGKPVQLNTALYKKYCPPPKKRNPSAESGKDKKGGQK